MKARLIREMDTDGRGGKFPPGHILDDPKCFRLVQMGCAEPADEECRLRANMTPEQMKRAQLAYERVSRGIHPEDYEAFDNGEMTGYDANGEWIPGPNYIEPEPPSDDPVLDLFEQYLKTTYGTR